MVIVFRLSRMAFTIPRRSPRKRVTSAARPARRPVAPTPAALAAETWILREPGSGTREIAAAGLAERGIAPKHTMELAGCETVKRAVVAGLGVGFVSAQAIALEAAQKLVRVVDAPGLRFRRQLYLITRKEARPSPAALAFMAQALKATAVY